MKTYEELVDEVYNDASFRSEFMSYVKLQTTLKTEEQELNKQVGFQPDDTPLMQKCKRSISVLYSSLFRGLSANYKLDAERARRIILDVTDRYK